MYAVCRLKYRKFDKINDYYFFISVVKGTCGHSSLKAPIKTNDIRKSSCKNNQK